MNGCSSGVEFGSLVLRLPPETAEALAARAAEIVLAELSNASGYPPYLTTAEAADYLRCSQQRIYDLRSSGQLSRYRDGSRALVSRAELDVHISAQAPAQAR